MNTLVAFVKIDQMRISEHPGHWTLPARIMASPVPCQPQQDLELVLLSKTIVEELEDYGKSCVVHVTGSLLLSEQGPKLYVNDLAVLDGNYKIKRMMTK